MHQMVFLLCFLFMCTRTVTSDEIGDRFVDRLEALEAQFREKEHLIHKQAQEIDALKGYITSEKFGICPCSEQHNSTPETDHIQSKGKRLLAPALVAATGVGFTAYLDHNVDIGNKQIIRFNQVITNDGSGFNPSTGVFMCSQPGVYSFTFFIGARDPGQVNAALVVNGNNILDAIVDPSHNQQDLQGGNAALVRLEEGDAVWVESNRASDHIEGSVTFRHTSFSGFFVYP